MVPTCLLDMPVSAKGSELLFGRSVCPITRQTGRGRTSGAARKGAKDETDNDVPGCGGRDGRVAFRHSGREPQVETPSPGLSAPAPNITDQKLDAAAAALKRVAVLQQTYRQRLAQAPAQADKDRITAEADTALTNAVADQGLTVEEYVSIMDVAQNDPEVRGKILQRIRPSQNDRN
jgi:hypothetical protein